MRRLIFIALLALIPSVAFAADIHSGEDVNITSVGSGTNDLYAQGTSVQVKAPATGESFLLGTTINSQVAPQRSLFAAGRDLTLNGAGYNLFALGSTIVVKGTTANDAHIVGGTVTFDPSSTITGEVWVYATDVTLAGSIGGNVHVYAQTVTSSAVIGGNLTGNINTLNFTGGSIGGKLDYTSNDDYTGSVDVKGSTTRTPIGKSVTPLQHIWGTLFLLIGVLLLGALFVWRAPKTTQTAVDVLTTQLGYSFLIGFASLILTPFVITTLIVSTIAIPVAFILGLLYLAFLLIAGILGLLFVGHFILVRLAPHSAKNGWQQLFIGAITITLLGSLPVIGSLIIFFFIFLGYIPSFGALTKLSFRRA
jgi:hypothetical protein